jgi:hypothetical protein
MPAKILDWEELFDGPEEIVASFIVAVRLVEST